MQDAPYRVVRPSRIVAQDGSPPPTAAKGYADRLLRLIPAEVMGGYTAIRGLWVPDSPALMDATQRAVLGWWLPVGGLVLVLALRVWGTPRPGQGMADVQWPVVGLAALAFVLWAAALGDPFLGFNVDQRIPASLLIAFGIAAPLLYRGSEA